MEQDRIAVIAGRIGHLSDVSGVCAFLYDLTARQFLPGRESRFCRGCRLAKTGRCNPGSTHLYGGFEAERWEGLYIYYCPLGLTFVSTVVEEEGRSEYAAVSGPIVMGSVADVLADCGGEMVEEILSLPQREPAQVTALAQTQWAISRFLSGQGEQQAGGRERSGNEMRNSMYDVTADLRETGELSYPLELEQRLQRMIVQGDKQGAQELINRLLGHLYFGTAGDFEQIREKAVELVILFSRAAIEGGADIRQIFGQNRNILAEVGRAEEMDQLSGLLVSVFNRFVGYVFDFGGAEHADILHKAVNYVREHHAQHITLDDVAAHVYLSKSYLSKLFKSEMGASFTEFVSRVRVERSKELLADPSLSLADIAIRTGFSDQSYYTKVFRSVTGLSPGQYRKSGGKRRQQP